jgi:hypothetical protein
MVMELARMRGRRLEMLMARPLVRPMKMGRRLRLQVLLTRPPIRGRLLGPPLLPRQQGPMALLMRLLRVFGVMARVLGLRVPVPVRAQALALLGPARVRVPMLVVLLVPKHPSARRKTKPMRTLKRSKKIWTESEKLRDEEKRLQTSSNYSGSRHPRESERG